MILQSLVEYYDALAQRNEISPPGWCRERVSYGVNLSPEGDVVDIITLMEEKPRGKKMVFLPSVVTVPERVVKAAGIKSNFLCDTADYLLGLNSKGNPERALKSFEACKQLHLAVLEGVECPAAQAIYRFFSTWAPEHAEENEILCHYKEEFAAANIVFWFGGKIAAEDAQIANAWDTHKRGSESDEQMICLVTGKRAPIAKLHGKIKNIPGGQSAGMNLIGFNARAFESYGKDGMQGLNAPVGEHAAFAYVTALNKLLADPKYCRRVGDTCVVYWAQHADKVMQETYLSFAFPPPEADLVLEGIMKNLSQGKPVDAIDMSTPFYVLGVSPNAARVSVRFFLVDNFGNMLNNIKRHYDDLEIVRPAYDNKSYLSIPKLLEQTVNPNSRDKSASPLLAGAVLRAILSGSIYPQALFVSIMLRIRADREINRARAAIIKAVLLRNYNYKEVVQMALNTETDNRAYVLGRLFAVLENAQQQAISGINTTIKDRYFTSACATPGSTFPQLLKLSAHHTAKAEYGKGLEIEKTELLGKLDVNDNPFPAHQSLQEQGLFILGYYQQVQKRYTKKEDATNGNDSKPL